MKEYCEIKILTRDKVINYIIKFFIFYPRWVTTIVCAIILLTGTYFSWPTSEECNCKGGLAVGIGCLCGIGFLLILWVLYASVKKVQLYYDEENYSEYTFYQNAIKWQESHLGFEECIDQNKK